MSTVLEALHALLDEVPVGSLAVRDGDAAEVSLVPFVLRRDPLEIVLFVSELSPHTAALRATTACALMVARAPTPDDPRDHHALTRVTVRASHRFVDRAEAAALGYEDRWRARFPHVAPMILGLTDFHFVALRPDDRGASFVMGFGRAYRVRGAGLDVVEHLTGR
jgi:putative heme iron utilization protein